MATQGKKLNNAVYMTGDLIGGMFAEITDYLKSTPLDEVIVPDEAPNAITTVVSINIKD